MPVPSLNAIGGTFAVAGLAAVVYFGAQAACPPAAPAAVAAPTAVAPPVVKEIPTPAPVVVLKQKPPLKFHKVTKMDCSWVPAITKDGYTKEQITSAAQQYGLSPAQVSALRACLN